MTILLWATGLPDHGASIVSAAIQATGTIAAALIAAFCAKKIVNNFQSHTYSNAPENVLSILEKARSDIFIVTAVGDKLMKVSEKVIARRLRQGIHVRYLLLDPLQFRKMEQYMHGDDEKNICIYCDTFKKLLDLQKKYPDLLEVRYFTSHMTASYIGIDTCPDSSRDAALLSPFVQVMMYQYHIRAKDSVLLYLYEKTNRACYDTTIRSMRDMWEDAI